MSADGSINLAQQVQAHLQTAGTPAVAQPEPAVDPLEARRQELTVLATEVAACDKCSELFSSRTAPVFGTGPLDAEVAFVGAAPGAAEDAQGEPFVGTGGQLLSRIIAACGFTRENVYLFNVIKCRPPKNRNPTRTECENCRVHFRRQYDVVQPKHLVALGEFTARLLTGRRDALAALRGQLLEYRGVPLVCTHHPDDIEKDKTGKLKPETWEDMKLLLQKMGRPVAPGKRE